MKFKATKIPKKESDLDEILIRFCLYFPQYTFYEAKQLPYKRLAKMLKVAQKEEARKMLELVHVVAAPHTKKGSGVKNLIGHYEDIIKR